MDINASDLLKQVTASLEKASSDFSAKAEQAFKEARAAGDASAETKASVDKLATESNTLRGTVEALKAQLGEVEQTVVAGTGGAGSRAAAMSAGAQVIASEALKVFAGRVKGNENTRLSVPVNAALLSVGVAEGVVEPQRLAAIDQQPRQRLFVRDLIAPPRPRSSGCSKPASPTPRRSCPRAPPSRTATSRSPPS